jgi:hypothetical protein
MRLLLALTALIAAVVANQRGVIEPFGPGKEFVYLYDGQVASGIPGASTQHAVTRIQARVVLVFNTESSAVLKVPYSGSYLLVHTILSPMFIFQPPISSFFAAA